MSSAKYYQMKHGSTLGILLKNCCILVTYVNFLKGRSHEICITNKNLTQQMGCTVTSAAVHMVICNNNVQQRCRNGMGSIPIHYRPPTKLREGNVFSGVCLLVILSTGKSPPVTITHNGLDLTV